MNYCSLEDAFPSEAPSPGCSSDQASRAARKEERRKLKRAKQLDPDRQQYGELPEVPAMNPKTGLVEHKTMDANQMNPFEPLLPIPPPTKEPEPSQQVQPAVRKSYFGKGHDEESFADYMPDQKDYQLQPDFLGAFEQKGLQKSNAPIPTNMFWKPATHTGSYTAFTEHVSPQKYANGDISMQDVMKRIDTLFAKLDDLNATTPQQMTSELLMFISSGIFVLFMMDLLVKKGSRMRF